MERALDLVYDELVIGADLSALSYSYAKKVPLIFIRQIRPYKYGFEDGFEEKTELYNKLLHKISFNGLCPLANKIQSMRFEDDIIKITTNTNCLIRIKYNKVILSDDYKIEGLPIIIGKSNVDNCVIDHLTIHEVYKLPSITVREDRVIRTIFFPNKYVTRVKKAKQLIVNSLITDEELKMVEFSEGYMRLRVRRIYEPKITAFRHMLREVHPLGKNLYEPNEKLIVLLDDYKTILNGKYVEDKYFSYLERNIWNR